MSVLDILKFGYYENIRLWCLEKSLEKIYFKRFDLLVNRDFIEEESKILSKIKKNFEF